jgi:hypothetical protein
MKIILVTRQEFELMMNRLNPQSQARVPFLTTPHLWLISDNALVMINEEVEIGKYVQREDRYEPRLVDIHRQVLGKSWEQLHPANVGA